MKSFCAALAAAVVMIALVGCGDSPMVVCPDNLIQKLTLPDTTTIKVGASTIAIAGASWGGCETGPPPPDFVWITSDPAVATVVALDSVHARIQGIRPGTAIVTPTYRTQRAAPRGVSVTVVP
jgi:hypothetical protein